MTLQGHSPSLWLLSHPPRPLPSVVRLSKKREEEVVLRSPPEGLEGLKELSGEDA